MPGKRIEILLVIDDPETVDAYEGSDPEIIAQDLKHGTLMEACRVDRVTVVDAGRDGVER